MQAHDITTTRVISVADDDSVMRAARLMLQHKISGVPVVDAKGNVVGIVTEGDFLRRGEIGTLRHRPRWLEFLVGPGRLAEEYVRACGRKVSEIMTPAPYTIAENASLDEIVTLMEKHRIKRLPVVRDGMLVGIVSRANILHAIAGQALANRTPAGDDASIRNQILAECAKQPWAPQIRVVVQNGIVELSGVMTDERERQAFLVAAENVPGVKAIHDHLVWVDAESGMMIQSQEDEARTSA